MLSLDQSKDQLLMNIERLRPEIKSLGDVKISFISWRAKFLQNIADDVGVELWQWAVPCRLREHC